MDYILTGAGEGVFLVCVDFEFHFHKIGLSPVGRAAIFIAVKATGEQAVCLTDLELRRK